MAAATAAGAARFVKELVTFVYRDAGDSWIDEESVLIPDLVLLASTVEEEQLALGFAESGAAAVVLRFGLFYGGLGNRGTDDALKIAKFRRSSIAGSSDAYMASIHCDVAASAVLAALSFDTGIYNIGDDHPMPRGEYLSAFASAFGIKTPKPTPGRLMKLGADRERTASSPRNGFRT